MSFGNRKRLIEEVEGTPLDPRHNDLDAFLVSCEDLNAGGHGIWYGSSVEESYSDELHDAYKAIDSILTESIAQGRTESVEGQEDPEGLVEDTGREESNPTGSA
jgi:hypothetical protein